MCNDLEVIVASRLQEQATHLACDSSPRHLLRLEGFAGVFISIGMQLSDSSLRYSSDQKGVRKDHYFFGFGHAMRRVVERK